MHLPALILLAVLSGLAPMALADLPWEPRFTWSMPDTDAPEQYTYRLYCTQSAPVTPVSGNQIVETVWAPNGDGASSWTAPRGTFGAGNWLCGLATVDGESESVLSNTVSFSVPLPAPANLRVE
jgi:hypothetical protein